jgi:hypothetical protein
VQLLLAVSCLVPEFAMNVLVRVSQTSTQDLHSHVVVHAIYLSLHDAKDLAVRARPMGNKGLVNMPKLAVEPEQLGTLGVTDSCTQ